MCQWTVDSKMDCRPPLAWMMGGYRTTRETKLSSPQSTSQQKCGEVAIYVVSRRGVTSPRLKVPTVGWFWGRNPPDDIRRASFRRPDWPLPCGWRGKRWERTVRDWRPRIPRGPRAASCPRTQQAEHSDTVGGIIRAERDEMAFTASQLGAHAISMVRNVLAVNRLWHQINAGIEPQVLPCIGM